MIPFGNPQSGDYDLTSEVVVYTYTLPANPTMLQAGAYVQCGGTAPKDLDAGDGTLTLRLTADDREVVHQVIDKRTLSLRDLSIPPTTFLGGTEIKILLTSSNANDTSVTVTTILGGDDLDYKEAQGLTVDVVKIIGDPAVASNIASVFLGTGHTDGVRLSAAQLLLDAATPGLGVSALQLIGGSESNGLDAQGGVTAAYNAGRGAGIFAHGNDNGHGAYFKAGGVSGHGIKIGGEADDWDGLYIGCHGTGHAINAIGGSGGGDGLRVTGQGVGRGFAAIGVASHGAYFQAGALGHGVKSIGGSDGGDGLRVTGQGAGKGLEASSLGDTVAAAILALDASALATYDGATHAELLSALADQLASLEPGSAARLARPSYTAAGGTERDLSAAQLAEAVFDFSLLDGAGDAVDATGLTLRFKALDADGTLAFAKTTGGGGITVSDQVTNLVTVTIDAADLPDAAQYTYELWDAGNDRLYARGKLTVRATSGPDAS